MIQLSNTWKKNSIFFEKILTKVKRPFIIILVHTKCRCSSMVEFQPSKLAMRVRFPLPAPVMFEHRTCNKKSISKMVDFFLQNVGVILIARPSKRGRTSSPLHIVCIKLIPTTYNQWSDNFTYIRKIILPRLIKSTRCIIAHYFTIIKSFKCRFHIFFIICIFKSW